MSLVKHLKADVKGMLCAACSSRIEKVVGIQLLEAQVSHVEECAFPKQREKKHPSRRNIQHGLTDGH